MAPPAVFTLAQRHGRFPSDAYEHVSEALVQIEAFFSPEEWDEGKTITAQLVVVAVAKLAAQRYGLLGSMVLATWGLRSAEQVKEVLAHLREAGAWCSRSPIVEADFALCAPLTDLIAMQTDFQLTDALQEAEDYGSGLEEGWA